MDERPTLEIILTVRIAYPVAARLSFKRFLMRHSKSLRLESVMILNERIRSKCVCFLLNHRHDRLDSRNEERKNKRKKTQKKESGQSDHQQMWLLIGVHSSQCPRPWYFVNSGPILSKNYTVEKGCPIGLGFSTSTHSHCEAQGEGLPSHETKLR